MSTKKCETQEIAKLIVHSIVKSVYKLCKILPLYLLFYKNLICGSKVILCFFQDNLMFLKIFILQMELEWVKSKGAHRKYLHFY